MCCVHPSSLGGIGPHIEAAGAGGRILDLGWSGLGFFCLGICNESLLSGVYSVLVWQLCSLHYISTLKNSILYRQRTFYFMGPNAVLGRCILRCCDVGERRDGYGPGSSGNDRQV